MGNALRFKHTSVPRQAGEMARVKVVHGPDFGAIYVITGPRATIGRGEDNDIMISDLKASRRHAELLLGNGGWSIKDAGSANGIMLNGKNTRAGPIRVSDTFTLGESTFEFITADAGTMMLVAPPRPASQLQAEQSALQEQKDRIKSFGKIGGGLAAMAGPGGSPLKNRRMVIWGVVILGGIYLMLGDDPKPRVVRKPANRTDASDLSKFLPEADNPISMKAAEQSFKEGFREYTAHNFLRAKTQFEMVLQVAPGHTMARMYLENCENAIKNEVKRHLETGKKDLAAGKLKEARGHFEAVQRLLFRNQTDPAFIEAGDQIKQVQKEIDGEGSG